MGQKKVIYIAGRITGVENYWKPFEDADDELTGMGYIVLTPTRLPWNLDNDRAMRICLAMIDQADAVYFLPGWEKSKGANLEMTYCQYTGKHYFKNYEELEEVFG
jgi:hypothetical protein